LLFENLGVHWDFNSQSGNSLGSVRVHSFTLSYIPGDVRCDSRASLLAHNFANPCFGREPKARVVTNESSKKFLCYGDDGMNVFQKGKTRVKNQIKDSWAPFLMGVHYVVHHTNLVT